MKRSGGKAGRPFGHLTIDQLEKHVSTSKSDRSELLGIAAELGHRSTKRAEALKDLVKRLLRSLADASQPRATPLPTPQPPPSRPSRAKQPTGRTALWRMTINRTDLIEAIGTARSRPTLRRVSGGPGGFEALVTFAASNGGLSIRSSNAAMDIPAAGEWASPIAVPGAALRRLAPKLTGPTVELSYADGQLALNQTRISAREL